METEVKVGLSAMAILAVVGTMTYFEQVSREQTYADEQCLLQYNLAKSGSLGDTTYCVDKATGIYYKLKLPK